MPTRTGIMSLPRASTITSVLRFFPSLGDRTGCTGFTNVTNAPGVGFNALRPLSETSVPRRYPVGPDPVTSTGAGSTNFAAYGRTLTVTRTSAPPRRNVMMSLPRSPDRTVTVPPVTTADTGLCSPLARPISSGPLATPPIFKTFVTPGGITRDSVPTVRPGSLSAATSALSQRLARSLGFATPDAFASDEPAIAITTPAANSRASDSTWYASRTRLRVVFGTLIVMRLRLPFTRRVTRLLTISVTRFVTRRYLVSDST